MENFLLVLVILLMPNLFFADSNCKVNSKASAFVLYDGKSIKYNQL
jgi:hypothetical protein|tara:strand:+ start:155 stop:292 length:138 start_codon:yes stop_codon:yes gene_type:complete